MQQHSTYSLLCKTVYVLWVILTWICWFDLSLCRCAIIFNFLCGWRATLPFSMLIDCILPPNFFGCLWVHTDSGWSWNSIFSSTSRVNSLAQLIVRAISESFSCFPNSSLWYWAFQVARRDFSALRHSSWFAYLSQYSVSNNQIVYLFVSFVTVLRSQSHGATRTLMHESGCLEVRYFLFNICQQATQATQLPQVQGASRVWTYEHWKGLGSPPSSRLMASSAPPSLTMSYSTLSDWTQVGWTCRIHADLCRQLIRILQ